jgi:hypothetical protein
MTVMISVFRRLMPFDQYIYISSLFLEPVVFAEFHFYTALFFPYSQTVLANRSHNFGVGKGFVNLMFYYHYSIYSAHDFSMSMLIIG